MELRKDIETLAIWYIPTFILMLIISSIGTGYIEDIINNSSTTGSTVFFLTSASQFLQLCDNLVVAIWLWFKIKEESGNKFLWSLFGLISSLLAAIIYLCIRIYEQNDKISNK